MEDNKVMTTETPTEEDIKLIFEDYNKLTDNFSALDRLQETIIARQQGIPEVWKTGFPLLDSNLDGGLIGEQLIFLGAISSLGKTSFALQIATQIAEQGQDVLIFSLEMSQEELNAKNISRYTHIHTKHDKSLQSLRLTTRDILNGKVGNIAFGQAVDPQGKVFMKAFDSVKAISEHIRIFTGNADVSIEAVKEAVDAHVKGTNKKPFVVLDYLQILQPSEEANTYDKRILTDYDVTRLKVLSRDYHIPVLVISAFNRNSYLDPVSMGSFRESSGIEYSSDILLAMQYKGMEYKKNKYYTEKDTNGNVRRKSDGKPVVKKGYENKTEHDFRVRDLLDRMDKWGKLGKPLPIELKILKNRNGAKGSIYYDFLPAYNYFWESDNQGKDDDGHALEWDSTIGDDTNPNNDYVDFSELPSLGDH